MDIKKKANETETETEIDSSDNDDYSDIESSKKPNKNQTTNKDSEEDDEEENEETIDYEDEEDEDDDFEDDDNSNDDFDGDEDNDEEDQNNTEINSNILLNIDDDNKEKKIYIDPKDRISKPKLFKMEKVRLIADRAKQLASGSISTIKNVDHLHPKEIAKLELETKKIPLYIEREIPGGKIEKWYIHELVNNEMEIINSDKSIDTINVST